MCRAGSSKSRRRRHDKDLVLFLLRLRRRITTGTERRQVIDPQLASSTRQASGSCAFINAFAAFQRSPCMMNAATSLLIPRATSPRSRRDGKPKKTALPLRSKLTTPTVFAARELIRANRHTRSANFPPTSWRCRAFAPRRASDRRPAITIARCGERVDLLVSTIFSSRLPEDLDCRPTQFPLGPHHPLRAQSLSPSCRHGEQG